MEWKVDSLIERRKKGWLREISEEIRLKDDREFTELIAYELMINDEFRKGAYKEFRFDYRKFIELFMRVESKEEGLKPFFLTPEQHDFVDWLITAKERFKKREITSIKAIVLKARQLGFTTLITAIQDTMMIVERNFSGFTMAHDDDATASIFNDKARGLIEELPVVLQPSFQKLNKKELITANRAKNKWRAATAGGKDPGRSKTLHFVHYSERAFYKDADRIDAAMLGAITKSAVVIIESTANGYNHFKELYDKAVAGENDYKVLFYPWYATPEYETHFESEEEERGFKDALYNQERYKGVDSKFMEFLHDISARIELIATSETKYQKLYWYFKMRQTLKEKVFQEYPTTPEQAFLASGNPYFDVELIDMELLKGYEPIETIKNGTIEIYENPVKGERYVIGADVAEGLEIGDKSTFFILNVRTGEEVANGEYTEAPDNHGRILDKYSRLYNNALIAPELNNHGHSVVNTLRNECKATLRIYIQETQATDVLKKTKSKYGWETTGKSKFTMLDELDTAMRTGAIKIKSKRVLKQLREILKEDGETSINGKDLVVAVAIAFAVRKSRPLSSGW